MRGSIYGSKEQIYQSSTALRMRIYENNKELLITAGLEIKLGCSVDDDKEVMQVIKAASGSFVKRRSIDAKRRFKYYWNVEDAFVFNGRNAKEGKNLRGALGPHRSTREVEREVCSLDTSPNLRKRLNLLQIVYSNFVTFN